MANTSSKKHDIFTCKTCDESFKTKRNYAAHNRYVHKKVFTCEFCLKEFTWEGNKVKHELEKHPDEKAKCRSCDIVFQGLKDMSLHKEFHAKKLPFLCLMCLTPFRSIKLLRKHLNQHEQHMVEIASVKNNLSDGQDKKIKTRVSFRVGAMIPNFDVQPKYFECNVCNKVVRSVNFREHLLSHEEKGQFKCHVCNDVFEYKEKLIEHLDQHKSSERKRKPESVEIRPLCHICGKTFAGLRDLRKHKEYHLPTGVYPCPICDRKFDLKIKLKIHVRYHRKKMEVKRMVRGKPGQFPCSICGKIFDYSAALKRHEELHKASYKCHLCERIFNKKWNLKTHMDIHQGKKPYSCSHCGASYTDLSNLKKHLLKHPPELGAKALIEKTSIRSLEDRTQMWNRSLPWSDPKLAP